MTDTTYNGHANRATWNVSLWLDNDEGLYREVQTLTRRARSVEQLAEQIEELCRAVWPNGKTPDDDSLDAADFEEIAQSNYDEYHEGDKEEEPEDKSTPLAAFIAKHELTFEAHRIPSRPDGLMDDGADQRRHFRCKINYTHVFDVGKGQCSHTDRSMSLYFSQGRAHTEPPTLLDVLGCCALDANSYTNSPNFEDWAAEYGYNTDSRKAEKIYRATKRQTEQLKRLLGKQAFMELLQLEV